MVHETAATGFARGAEEYEKGRPGYPHDAVARVVDEFSIAAGSSVADIGAGTGKLTRLLVPTGARIVAVEPVAEMREVLSRTVAGVTVVEGTGEEIPLDDMSCDLVVFAQTLHWVDVARAAPEIARVLRPGGGLAMLWNRRDRSVGWTDRIWDLMDEISGRAPRYVSGEFAWRDQLDASGLFTAVASDTFRLDHPTDIDATLARVASTSYVSALPDAERAEILDKVRTIVADASLGEQFTEPYITEVYWCRKR